MMLGFACALSVHAAPMENWAQWRGPLGTGEGPQADPPLKWSGTENVKWKVKLPGRGTGTPVVWGEQIFLLAAIPTGKNVAEYPSAVPGTILAGQQQGNNRPAQGQEGQGRRRGGGGFGRGEKPTEEHQFVILSIDRKTGKTLWQQTARQEVPHEGHHQDHTFSSASAVTDGEQVFAFFGSRGLYAYDMKGNLQWSKDFGDQTTRMGFGEGSSPGLFKDTIVINWDHEGEDFVVALNKKTGEEIWRKQRDEATSWSTPLIVEHDGKAQVIVAATKKVISYDLKDGSTIWECSGLTGNVIPTPIYHEGMVYVTSGFRGNALLAIKLGRTGNLDETDAIVWKHGKGTPYVPTPVLYDGKLYITSHNNPIITCFDAKTGKAIFEEERLSGPQGLYASPVAAKDKIYVVGRNGTTAVLKNSDKLEVLATNVLGEPVDASPALVGKEMYIRGHEHLYCIAN
jgi:outer membrane protein assembly factor BamB